MKRFLLDANVLIALMDPAHVHHGRAHTWFKASGSRAWASCPLTQNAVLRIVGSPRYPNSPGTPAAVGILFARFLELPGHQFWPDDLSLLGNRQVRASSLLSSSQITDSYLLALAVAHGGQLATLDGHLRPAAVIGGDSGLHCIP